MMPNFADVSHHNSDFPKTPIDWVKVKASGIEKVYIKASEGNNFVDNAFATNWSKAKAVEVQRGAYHFFRANVSGVSQAAKFKSVVGTDIGELPPAIDVEDGNGVDKVTLTSVLRTCLQETERLFGVKPVIYTSQNAWNSLTTSPAWISEYSLWLAAPDQQVPPLPNGASSWWLHQFSWNGKVDGIDGEVDLDRENAVIPVPPDESDDVINSELDKISMSVSSIREQVSG